MYCFEEGMVVQAQNLSTLETEAGGWLDPGKPVLYSKMLSKNKENNEEREKSSCGLITLGLWVAFLRS